MNQLFAQLISQLNSSVFVLIAILVFFFIAVPIASWKMSAFIAKWQERHREHERSLDKIEKKIDIIPKLEAKIELIYSNTLRQPLTQSNSPITLTDAGKEVAKIIKAATLVDKYKYLFVDALGKNYQRLNAYDIQQKIFDFSSGAFDKNLTDKEINTIKDEAYNRGLLDDDIFRVIAILVRDEILSDLGMNKVELDKHDPNRAKD